MSLTLAIITQLFQWRMQHISDRFSSIVGRRYDSQVVERDITCRRVTAAVFKIIAIVYHCTPHDLSINIDTSE